MVYEAYPLYCQILPIDITLLCCLRSDCTEKENNKCPSLNFHHLKKKKGWVSPVKMS